MEENIMENVTVENNEDLDTGYDYSDNEVTDVVPCEEESGNGLGAVAAVAAVGVGAGILLHRFVVQPIGNKIKTAWENHKAKKEAKAAIVDDDVDPQDDTDDDNDNKKAN